MADKSEEIMAQLMGVGVSEHDALVIADCIVTRKSCSWVNTDETTDKLVQDLNHLIEKNGYGVKVVVDAVPTRSKFIWEVKII
jgi:predicted metal-binding protein